MLSNNVGRGRVGGPATTAPGENGQFCGSFGCHFSDNFDPELSIQLVSSEGDTVTEYIPGEIYSLNLEIKHTGFPAGYGFQIVSLKDSDNSALNQFVDIPSGIHDIILGGRQYVEQNSRLPFDSIPLSWQAPPAGTGTVAFYGAGNAVNGNGSSSGDGADTSFLKIVEGAPSSIDELLSEAEPLSVTPNPVSGPVVFTSEFSIERVDIFDLRGNLIITVKDSNVDLSGLTSGTYFAKARGSQQIATARFIKI